jgi:hypothetical protein
VSSILLENGLRLAAHQMKSLDLAPSGLFLFGHVRHCLQGMALPSHEELLEAIRETVTVVPTEAL